MLRRQFNQGAVVAAALALIPEAAHAAQGRGCAVFNVGPNRAVLVTPSTLKEMLAQTGFPVSHIYMNAWNYADIRKFGRDIIDIETCREKLVVGVQCYLWADESQTVRGAEFRTRGDVPQGVIIMASAEVVDTIPQLPHPTQRPEDSQFPWFSPSLSHTPLWTLNSKEPSDRPVLV